MEGVDCTGAIRVRHQLVDVAAPSLLRVITHDWLEGSEDGREERGWRRGRTTLQRLLSLLLAQTVKATYKYVYRS